MHKVALVVVLLGSVASSTPAKQADFGKPTLSFGSPTISGSLDGKTLATVVKKSTTKLLACYKTALAQSPGLQGTATATFTINTDGKVADADVDGLGEDADACIKAVITKLKFSVTKESVGVVYPLDYDPGYQGIVMLTGTGDISDGFDDTNIYGGMIGNQAGEELGGFGYGSGTEGWATIGTGRYGTIGRGGTGYGIGHAESPPLISIGQPTVVGALDQAIVRRYVKRNVQKLQYCYEKELLTNKTLQGTVTAAFTIAPNGSVGASTASGMKNKSVESCIASVIHDIEFPKPKGGADVTVSYPFTLKPPSAKKTK